MAKEEFDNGINLDLIKDIEFIENGMELSRVRDILNAIIKQVNDKQAITLSYKELKDQPCINGVELTAKTSAEELNISFLQLADINELGDIIVQIVEQKAIEAATQALKTKLDSDFSGLPDLEYNLKEDMLLPASDGKQVFKVKISDFMLYLKYLILQDKTFIKLLSGGQLNIILPKNEYEEKILD